MALAPAEGQRQAQDSKRTGYFKQCRSLAGCAIDGGKREGLPAGGWQSFARAGPRPPPVLRSPDTDGVILSRNWSVFLVLAGAFNWTIWPRFALAIWNDQRAWSGAIGQSSPTSFLLVHAILIVTAVVIGTIIAILGVRAFLADRRARAARPPVLSDR